MRFLRIVAVLFAGNVILNICALLFRTQSRNLIARKNNVNSSLEQKSEKKPEPYIVPKLNVENPVNNVISNDVNQAQEEEFKRHEWSDSFLPNNGMVYPLWKELIPKNYSRTANFVLGVPTISRQGVSYLHETLRSLVDNLGVEQQTVVIVVYIGESDNSTVEIIAKGVRDNFAEEIQSGLIHVISPPKDFYPDWEEQLRRSFGDSFLRTKWRSKQNLDQIFLMMYAYYLRPKYYVMMEDDVIASKDYLTKIYQDAEAQNERNFVTISYCQLGAIGKLFRRKLLPSITTFIALFWADKPLDWLLWDYMRSRVCNFGEDIKKCFNSVQEIQLVYKPSLFQHIGTTSSFPGKKQLLKDKSFKP